MNADDFRLLEIERTQALVAGKLDVMERLHTPDYQLITPAGRVLTREHYFAQITQAPFYTGWEVGPAEVRLAPTMAVIRYLAKLSFPSGKTLNCWHTDVYALQDGAWRALWSQATEQRS